MMDSGRPTDFDRDLRLAVYRHFVDSARAPAPPELAEELGVPLSDVQESLLRLQAHRALALTPATNNIWMAHPFSAVPTAFPVETAERTYWANCAWDALAIPTLVGTDATIAARCADCAEPLTIRVRGGLPLDTDAVVHFLVPPRGFWENIGFT